MQSQSREVKEVKSDSEDSLLREVVGNLINGKLEKISLMVATNEASEEDLAYNQLLLEMLAALPEKNRANLFDDFAFLQQDQYQHQNADEGEDEGDDESEDEREDEREDQDFTAAGSTESNPVPMEENFSQPSEMPEDPVIYSPEETRRRVLLKTARTHILKLAVLLHTDADEYNQFILDQKKHIKAISVAELENFIDATKEKITLEKKESEKNKTINLQKTLFEVAESLIPRLTDLQRKNAREKEEFREEQLMILKVIAYDIDGLRDYIRELRSQIDKLDIHAKRQKVLGAESKEEKVAAPIGSSPSSVCEGLPRTFISPASSVGSSPKFPEVLTTSSSPKSPEVLTTSGSPKSPEVSPTSSRRSSSSPRSSGLTFFESSSVSSVEPEVPAIADVPVTVTPFHPVSPRRSLSGGSEN